MMSKNIGKFSQYFRQNFIVVDNNDAKKMCLQSFQTNKTLVRKSTILSKMWIASELKRKKTCNRSRRFAKY